MFRQANEVVSALNWLHGHKAGPYREIMFPLRENMGLLEVNSMLALWERRQRGLLPYPAGLSSRGVAGPLSV